MKKTNKFLWMIGSFVLVLAMALQLIIPSKAEANSVVDDNTIQHWKEIVDQDTNNVGRIWTDKTVTNTDVIMDLEGTTEFNVEKGDSEFVVTYSALSSTSNTSTTVTKPLDIAIVMDSSGSMNENLNSYQEIYNPTPGSSTEYYVLVNGEYRTVSYSRSEGKWYYGFFMFPTYVTPKTGPEDNTAGHVQFYKQLSKMDALKNAVNAFVDETATQNTLIQDVTKRHQLSLITFSSASNVRQEWIAPNAQNKDSIKNIVNRFTTAGATGADYGLQEAIDQFAKTTRPDSQKVVIFFTDGEPNHGNGFSETVANTAIKNAKSLKDDGAWIYSIGVFQNANPETTQDNFNAYMHGISSNYPNATAYDALGERKPDSNYYKAATNADELDSIFSEISQEINTGNLFPTETEDGFAGKSGYLTYTDRLGPYMKVDDFKALIFADQKFVNPQVSTVDNVTTYTFDGVADTGGNVLYPEGDVNQIEITVTKGQGSQGDLVQIRIPGGMIPLRQFTVSHENDQTKMTINEALPLRLFYGVSLRDDVMNLLRRPDQAMVDYIKEHNDDQGNVYFYANDFDLNHKDAFDQDAILGKATSEFTPALSNSFYYFTEDTMIYADKDCKTPAKDYVVGQEYYYKKPYYAYEKQGSDIAVLKEEIIRFNASALGENRGDVISDEEGNIYIKAGAPRLTRVADTRLTKTNNNTGTATEVTNPHWDSYTLTDPKDIIVYLGNNGRLSVNIPGALKVTKAVTTSPEGLNAPDKEFTFKFDFTDKENQPANGPFDVQIFENQAPTGEIFTIENGGTVKIKANQMIYILGLADGISYNVTEVDLPEGFTTNNDSYTGTISHGDISEVDFTNTYTLKSVKTNPNEHFKYQKVLEGREWLEGDSFEFVLDASNDQTPLPTPTATSKVEGHRFTQTVTNGDVGSFGEIEYTKPGDYYYTIIENKTSRIPGISFDSTTYIIKVTVKDNELGQLVISEYTLYNAQSDVAVFTNTYNANATVVRPSGYKYYTDNSLDRPLQKDMFTFKLSTTDEDAPMPDNVVVDSNERYITTTNYATGADLGRNIFFEEIKFESKHVRTQPYVYTVKEVIPDDRTGIEYDESVWTIEVTVTSDDTNKVVVRPTFKLNGEEKQIEAFEFSNVYTPISVTPDGDDLIGGYKVLTGRDMKQGEVYEFTLTPVDGTVGEVMTAKVENAKAGAKTAFHFEGITFNKPGTYNYVMKETAPQDGNGLTVDKTEHQVQIVVTDTTPGQPMDYSITYDGQVERPTFTNEYKAELNYRDVTDSLIVTKTLTGRDLNLDEFTFEIQPVSAAMKEKIGESPITFKNTPAKDGSPAYMKPLNSLKFTQEDVGKEFIMNISEVQGNLGGVTYDKNVHEVTITITDNGDGTLNATTSPSTVGFVNTYEKKPAVFDSDADVSPKLAKRLIGRDWYDTDAFTFVIEPLNGAPTPDRTEVTLNGDYKERQNVPFSFGRFIFENEGRYQYTIKEVAGDSANMIYSTQVTTLTIIVTDDKNGQLVAVPSYDTNYYFENFYEASYNYRDNVDVSISKQLNGHALEKDQFTFTIKPVDQQSANRLNIPLDQGIQFTNPEGEANKPVQITLNPAYNLILTQKDLGKVYTYEIQEVIPDEKNQGITYDTRKYTLTIEAIYDETTGNLSSRSTLKINDGQAVEVNKVEIPFVNSYEASGKLDGSTNLQVTKEIAGRNWLEDDEFTFTLTTTASSDDVVLPNPSTITISDKTTNHTTSFGDITFKKPGTYAFVISESKTNIPGMTDASPITFTVQVEDNDDGTLSASIVNKPVFTFVNSYKVVEDASTSVNLDVQKELVGRDWLENESFSFELVSNDEATTQAISDGNIILPQTLTTSITGQNGTVNFEAITFKKEGTYTFKVTEQIPEQTNGITYDNHEVIYTVVVEDDLHGGLTSSVTVNGDKKFTNTYATSSTNEPFIKAPMSAKKVLNGRPLVAGEFSFVVTAKQNVTLSASEPVANQPMPTKTTATNDAQGNFDFGTITFDKQGTYVYEVREVIPTEAKDNVYQGVTYSTKVYELTYEVSENLEKGIFEVNRTVTLDGQAVDTIVFENTYKVSPTILNGSQELAGNKTVVNGDENAPFVLKGDDFQFEIKAKTDGAPLPEQTIVTNDQNGNFNFGNIEYSTAGTYQYTISEVNSAKPGISYDANMILVTVEVSEDFTTGTLKTKVTMDKELKFTNTYDPLNVSASISGTKTLIGRELVDGEFTFTLKPKETTEDPGFVLKDNQTSLEAKNNVQGIFYFGDDAITFTKAGEYHFEISELAGNDPNITYSDKVIEVIAKVTDEEGVLACAWENLDQVKFENNYQPFETSFVLEGQKTLTGRNLNDGEFTFTMKDMQGNIVSTGKNDKDGKITFSPVTFKTAGTYQYEVYEEKNNVGGITYDEAKILVIVDVKDNKGQLEATANSKDVVFNNTYKANKTAVSLSGLKQLSGRALNQGEFTFILKDEKGNVLQEKANLENGMIQFDTLTYTSAGKYIYTIHEVVGNDEEITYDKAIYQVEITITDTNKGYLEPQVVLTKDGKEVDSVLFTNTYEKTIVQEEPQTPTTPSQPDDTVNTGDNLMIYPYVMVAIVSLVFVFVLTKKKKCNK